MRVAVIGTGLIGTSVALALREQGVSVWLADTDPEAARLAVNLGAGEPLPETATADVAVIAVPPSAVAATLAAVQARGLASCYTDVASVKQLPVTQARALGCDMTSYVPSHPLAGREKHGPAAARADLFLGRTWALCPVPGSSEQAVAAITTLVRTCGAVREFTVVQVVIRDQPGELTRLFDAAGRAGVNIEDVRIEHSPGLPVGVAELSVRPAEAGPLLAALEAGAWPVRR